MNVSEIKSKTANATRWSAISELVAKCITPVTNIILARLLTPEAFGVVATVAMVVSFADMFTDAGFQKYLVQHEFSDDDELDKHTDVAFWSNITISFVLWGIICVFNEKIALLVGSQGLGIVIIVAAVSLPISSFSSIQMARFKRDFKFKEIMPARIIGMLIPLVVTVPIAFITHSYWSMVIGTIISNLTVAVLLFIKSQWKPRLYFSLSVLKEMFVYSWWILLESISIWLTNYIDIFIVGSFLSVFYVGLYKTAMATVNQVLGLVSAATSMPLFASLSRLKNNDLELKHTYAEYIEAISIFIIPLGVGMYIFRDVVVTLFLGSQWREITDFIGLWSLVCAISIVLGSYCNGLYNAVGKTYLSFLSQILQLVVLIPVLVIVAPYGFEALYISRSLIRLELVFVQFLIMKIVLRIGVLEQIKVLVPSTIGSVLMVCVGVLLKNLSDWIIWQFVCIIVCVLVYFVVLRVLFKDRLSNAITILGIKR